MTRFTDSPYERMMTMCIRDSQGDAFDSIREEYTTMLQNQLASHAFPESVSDVYSRLVGDAEKHP